MSHLSKIRCFIRSLEDAALAAQDCGMKLEQNQTTFRSYGQRNQNCDHRIRLVESERAFDVGLRKARQNPDGSIVEDRDGPGYVMVFDNWNGAGGTLKHVGRDCSKLTARYGYHRLQRAAKEHGCSVQEDRDSQGRVRLKIRKPAQASQKVYAKQY